MISLGSTHATGNDLKKILFRFINHFHLLRYHKYHDIKLDEVLIKNERNIPFQHCWRLHPWKMIFQNLFISLLTPPAAVSNANSQSALNIKRGGNKPEREDFYRLHLIFCFIVEFLSCRVEFISVERRDSKRYKRLSSDSESSWRRKDLPNQVMSVRSYLLFHIIILGSDRLILF